MPMSDFELVYLLTEAIMNTVNIFMHLFAIVSGFLLVVYFLVDRLTKLMAALLNSLFIVTYLILGSTTYSTLLHIGSFTDQVRTRTNERGGLEWNVVNIVPGWVEDIGINLFPLLLIVVLVAAQYFFFQTRNPSKPKKQ